MSGEAEGQVSRKAIAKNFAHKRYLCAKYLLHLLRLGGVERLRMGVGVCVGRQWAGGVLWSAVECCVGSTFCHVPIKILCLGPPPPAPPNNRRATTTCCTRTCASRPRSAGPGRPRPGPRSATSTQCAIRPVRRAPGFLRCPGSQSSLFSWRSRLTRSFPRDALAPDCPKWWTVFEL